MESDPLAVVLRIHLGLNLAFADLLDKLGRNLNVMVNQESKMISRCFFQGHTPQDRCTGRPLGDLELDG